MLFRAISKLIQIQISGNSSHALLIPFFLSCHFSVFAVQFSKGNVICFVQTWNFQAFHDVLRSALQLFLFATGSFIEKKRLEKVPRLTASANKKRDSGITYVRSLKKHFTWLHTMASRDMTRRRDKLVREMYVHEMRIKHQLRGGFECSGEKIHMKKKKIEIFHLFLCCSSLPSDRHRAATKFACLSFLSFPKTFFVHTSVLLGHPSSSSLFSSHGHARLTQKEEKIPPPDEPQQHHQKLQIFRSNIKLWNCVLSSDMRKSALLRCILYSTI